MTVLISLFVGLVALVVLIVLIGFALPERSDGRFVARLASSPEEVWEALQDVDAHPMTGKSKRSLEHLPEEAAGPHWREDMGHGEIIDVRTLALERPRRLVRTMASQASNMTSEWEYRLDPLDGGTRLEVSGATHIRRGTWHMPIFRVMMRVGGGVRAGMRIQARMLAASLGVELETVA
ncbi:MAG: hypothetical protein AAFZ65_15170 [Planctomycetota bacterium]